ncbi:hypothetical protein PSI9734_01792 [Pseudidiomarina piscicola]|uniref:DUF4124 domain-containing protein n=1 Tax=Pseudidiomarina piscicola TaxID=2614830 RepID=A0A6S6WS53_9GAMM|nr:DUF4124 domain-containing protein [Pseudidiomarina piscicola]CAB0151404.1 hypothetical protein PSI9734_01792 [Pseudidiomarina piscicola]VZT40884.1 hypothetical protein PSI9734_01792 [Pseudomonas aeruginosa]
MHRLVGKGIVVSMFVSLLLLAVPSDAQVYRKVLEDGTVVYTDQKEEGAEQVSLNVTTSEFAPPKDKFVATDADTDEAIDTDPQVSASVEIVSPAHEATVRDNEGRLIVAWADRVRNVRGRVNYELYVDGQVAYQGLATGVSLEGLNRGEHRLQVRMYNEQGAELARSDTTVIYMHQASIFNPALNNNTGGTSGQN